jgi:hypothetical protein
VTYLGYSTDEQFHQIQVRRMVIDDMNRRPRLDTVACSLPRNPVAATFRARVRTLEGGREVMFDGDLPGGPFTRAELRNKRNGKKVTSAQVHLWRQGDNTAVLSRWLAGSGDTGFHDSCSSGTSGTGYWADPEAGDANENGANPAALAPNKADDRCRYYEPGTQAEEGISFVVLDLTYENVQGSTPPAVTRTICIGPNLPSGSTACDDDGCGEDGWWLRAVELVLIVDPANNAKSALEIKRTKVDAAGNETTETVVCTLE